MKAAMLERGMRLRTFEEKSRFCEEDVSQKLKGIGNIKTKRTCTKLLSRKVTIDKDTGS
jgi:hypothetical protein